MFLAFKSFAGEMWYVKFAGRFYRPVVDEGRVINDLKI